MKIPPAAIAAPQAAAPQASTAHANAIGFAQALFAAGFTDSAPSLPAQRNIGYAKQQPAKEPSKDRGQLAVTVPVAIPLQATLAPPLRILPFSRETENHEPAARSVKETNRQQPSASAPREVTLPAETPTPAPAIDAAPDARVEKPQTPAASAVAVREVPNPPAQQNPSPALPADLAFAAKVQPAAAPVADPPVAPRPLPHDITAPEQAKRAAEKDAADATLVQPIAAGAEASLSSQGQPGQLAQFTSPELASPQPAAPSASPAPAAPLKPVEMKVPEPQVKPPTVPLKDISLQVSQPGDQKVEVRVVQQSGELHVAVRTGDSDLAHGMQQGLSDLVGRLQDNGFRAEAWRPGGSTAQSGPVFEARSSPGGSQNGDPQSYSGGSHQEPGERRQNQSQRPAWVDELESNLGGAQPQGANYGIGS